jgi:putative membrane protein
MKGPVARPVTTVSAAPEERRTPRAFVPANVETAEETVSTWTEPETEDAVARPPRLMGWLGRIAWGEAGLLVSLALGLAADRLIRDLFTSNEWLGWLGLGVLGVFLVAVVALAIREMLALSRLRALDRLRARAAAVLRQDGVDGGRAIARELDAIYEPRADLARAREKLAAGGRDLFDGSEYVRLAERTLMAPLDARARALTAASARRVALVTTVSPRALIDIAFVIFESVRLGGDIARLYGARPGLFGSWRLVGAILAHLAVTGGLVLTDGVMEQLVGQGLAAKLSARLGEGLVNGLMTVRVGIAAMRVVRPLPFETQRQPVVRDFLPELANVMQREPGRGAD